MDKQVVWIEHPAAIMGLRKRHKKSKWIFMQLNTPVQIGHAEAFEAPEAVVTSYQRIANGSRNRKETVRRSFPGMEGRLWAPIATVTGAPFDAARLNRPGAWADAKYWPFPKPLDHRGRPLPEEEGAMLNVVSIDTDMREAKRQLMGRIGERIANVGGTLYRQNNEPVWRVSVIRGKAELDYGRVRSSEGQAALVFRIDQRDIAEAAARALSTKEAPKLSRMCVEAADPAYLNVETMPALISSIEDELSYTRRIIEKQKFHSPSYEAANEELKEIWCADADWSAVCASLRSFGIAAEGSIGWADRAPWYGARQIYPGSTMNAWADLIEAGQACGLVPAKMGVTVEPQTTDTDDDLLADILAP